MHSGRALYEFGPFRVDGTERTVTRDDVPIALTDKVFELLWVLVQNRGRALTKAELMEKLWPDTVVEENNLTVNMSMLRKALGESAGERRYVETLPRRGYRFIADVREAGAEAPDLAVRHQPTFVGRDAELARLLELLGRARNGHGRVVFINGDPGMGKTELAEQFLALASRQGRLLLARGRCLEQFGTGEAYLPFLEACRALLVGPDRERIAPLVRRHAPTWFAQFGGVSGPTDTVEALRNELRDASSGRMLREMGDALEALAQLEPVVLLLEDMHWADPSSSDLLRLLGQRAMARRLLILATLRGSDVELDNHPMKNVLRELSARDQCEELMLPLLDQAAIGRYVDARFQPHDMGPDVAELLAKTTEGHPLFVTRLVQMLVERGDIEHDGKRWRTSRPLAELELRVPNGVRGLIQKKLDSLAEDDRRALQYASVIGVEFDSSALAFVLERDELAVDDQLDALARVHHLLEPLGGERLGDGQLSIRYRFAHVLYQNVLYESLAARRRMLLHQKAAEHLSAALGKDDFRVAAQLALHYEAARDYGRAIQYSRHAADNAARLHANRVAEQHCARALHLIEHLPPSRQIPETVIMRYDHGWCAANAGDGESSIRDFETMLHAARSPEFAGPSPEAARARDAVFDYLEQPWRDAFGLFDMPRMPNQDRSMGAAAIQCEAYWALSFLLIQRGRLDEAAARIGEYLALAQASHNEPRQAEALAFRAWLELERGNFEAALASVESGLPAARAISHARAIFSFLCTGAQVRQLRGDYELAEALSLEALPLNMETVGRVDCLWEVARARAHLGRVSAALAPLAEALDIARRTELVDETQRVLATLGWLHAEIGDLEGAVRHFASAIELAPAAPAARALRLRLALALARCGRGDPTGAASELERRDPIEPSSPAASAGMHPASGRHPQATELESHAADAELQLARGDARAATIAAKALLQAATALGSPKHVELARLVLARAALIRDDVASALEHAHAGTALLVERPMPLIGWRLYDALGAAQRAAGDAAAATAAVTRALDLVDLIERGIEDPALRAIWSSSREVRELRAGAWNHPQGPPSSPRLSSGVGG